VVPEHVRSRPMAMRRPTMMGIAHRCDGMEEMARSNLSYYSLAPPVRWIRPQTDPQYFEPPWLSS
jgi:hypothetical protein